MAKKEQKQYYRRRYMTGRSGGMALAVTLMVLVVLSTIVAVLTVRVAQVRLRQRYIMDYQKALYGLDSMIKYAMTILPEKNFSMIDREDAPDFSDLFWLDQDEYLQYINAWMASSDTDLIEKYLKKTTETKSDEDSQSLFARLLAKISGSDEPNDPNEEDSDSSLGSDTGYIDPNQIEVPGPYGPAWPNVIKPIELEIGDCKVTMAVEDENAKMPLSWLVTSNMETNKQAQVALETFGEWMSIDSESLSTLVTELETLSKYKTFSLSNSPILLPAEKSSTTTSSRDTTTSRRTSSRSRRIRTSRRSTAKEQEQTQTQQKVRPEVAHAADFAKLFHSSLLDLDSLAVPQTQTAFEGESPLKYLALWGSQRVNINTAPRQVLEAAFSFGGKPVEVADAIIKARKEKPFKTISALKKTLSEYSDSFDKAEPYIDAESKVFTIHVTSRCGNASVSAIAAVIKENKQMERLVILYGR